MEREDHTGEAYMFPTLKKGREESSNLFTSAVNVIAIFITL